MEMLFDPEHYVTGKFFFGREDELSYFKKNLFDAVLQGESRNYSITGMNKIGKTSLMKELCRRFQSEAHPDVYVVDSTLDKRLEFWPFWIKSVLEPLFKQLDAALLAHADEERKLLPRVGGEDKHPGDKHCECE